MNKTLIVCDTTSAMNLERSKKEGIELLSLSVIIDNVEYKDQIDISTHELYQKLKEGALPSTSQPNTGYLMRKMYEWKEQNYDDIVILCCSSNLSGTYSGVMIAKDQCEMENVTVVDTRTIGAPILDMAIYAKKMADDGKSGAEIVAGVKVKMANTFSFLYPETLKQLARGGRLSPVAAGLAGMLKIKVLLALDEQGNQIDRFDMARTETKLLRHVREHFQKIGIDAQTHKLYVSHADNYDVAIKVAEYLKLHLNNIDIEILEFPAVLSSHAGIGSIAIQSTYKM